MKQQRMQMNKTPEFVPGPPGTGKTHVWLKDKYAEFLEAGYEWDRIVVLSHTNTAAEEIVKAANEDPDPGNLTLADLKNYKVVFRPVICGSFRDMKICTSSPPSSGGAQIMIAGLYDHLIDPNSNETEKIIKRKPLLILKDVFITSFHGYSGV